VALGVSDNGAKNSSEFLGLVGQRASLRRWAESCCIDHTQSELRFASFFE